MLTLTISGKAAAESTACMSAEALVATITSRDPRIRDAWIQVDAAQARLKQVSSSRFPQIGFFGRAGVGDGVLADNEVDNRSGLRFTQKFLDFGAGRNARKSAQAGVDASRHAAQSLQLRVAGEGLQTALDLERRNERIAALEAFVAYYQAQEDLIDMRLEKGVLTEPEAAAMRVEGARIRAELRRETMERDNRTRQLERFTAIDDVCVATESFGPFIAQRVPQSLTELEAVASADPGLLELAANITSSEAELQQVHRERWPTLDFNAVLTQDYDSFRGEWRPHHRVGLDLDLPILSGGRRKADVSAAEARVRSQKARFDTYVEERRQKVRSDWGELVQLRSANEQYLIARDNQALVVDAVFFEVSQGSKTMDDLIEAQRAQMNAILAEIDSRYELEMKNLDLVIDIHNIYNMPEGANEASAEESRPAAAHFVKE
ncbi:TolC family protein [Asticcacaulis biprosthecium]|uniref:TolC family protein n=1 Tax=Asticcacaulis biprosthecium TaxID=76891 RepID=UPI001B7FB05A|nr:TolC family protein [Asticcacaulis biprosthecium]